MRLRATGPLVVLLWISAAPLAAAAPEVSPDLLAARWPAEWIAPPDASLTEYGVFLFRRVFELPRRPDRFVVHVSADNRYRLFVNAAEVGSGPARGDLAHWRFETYDLAGLLRAGRNVLAARVWNFGELVPFAQVTWKTAFLLQGDSEREKGVSTGGGWKVRRDDAWEPFPVERARLGWPFMVVGPGDRFDASRHPWGWRGVDHDDSAWKKPRSLGRGVPYGVRNFSVPWALVARDIPPLEDRIDRLARIVRSDLPGAHDGFLRGDRPLEVPPRTRARLLLDRGWLTVGTVVLVTSKGAGSRVRLEYAEALVDAEGRKGHRDEIEGRQIRGLRDEVLPAGGDRRVFRTQWLRTYRYLQLEIETAAEPLLIDDLHGRFTAYPFAERASFRSDDPSLGRIWSVSWRTARLCAGETYFDCPYYEQLQYVGDTRIQALVSLYVAGDDRLMRKAIRHFDDSRIPEGLTQSRYPHCVPQIIPTYSLFWISMIHDHWMHRDDPEFVRGFRGGIRGVLEWFEDRVDETGMLGPVEWWNFVDWTPEYAHGEPPGVKDGHSAVVSLTFAYALRQAADLAAAFGDERESTRWRERARALNEATRRLCWDADRGLLADSPEKKLFSQHANVMAVLAGLFRGEEAREVMRRVLEDHGLVQCTFYYRFYLVRALVATGLGERYFPMLDSWRRMLDLGLTTFAEKPEPTRSDCHAWSASPLYELLATVCGVRPAAPGFRRVLVAPALGPLHRAEARIPHPRGEIHVRLEREGESGIEARITLPDSTSGTFRWRGKDTPLAAGTQTVRR